MSKPPQRHPSAIHASLGFLLTAAVEELFPDRTLYIEHSFIGGYYCHFGPDEASRDDLLAIGKLISAWTHGDQPIQYKTVDNLVLNERYTAKHRADKLAILARFGTRQVPAIQFRGFLDYCIEPVELDMSQLQKFSLDPYDDGFVLRFPSLLPPHEVPPLKDSPKLYQVIQERETWGRALRVNNLHQLNQQLESDRWQELIWVAEGLHEKKIAAIADNLVNRQPVGRLVFVAGPSSSGKTTFAKRLAVQIKVNTCKTLTISMDDYFKNRDQMPLLPDGTRNFEDVSALDMDILAENITSLLSGRSVKRRRFDFRTGEGYMTDETLIMDDTTFLIIEGIHGLNPIFGQHLGMENIQRVYISAITQLNVDNEHRLSSSDNRLIRRLVRDSQFRGYGAEETIFRWPSVRLGEEKHIFTYQEAADFMFNSALVYELAVLKSKAEDILRQVPEISATYPEAQRLLTILRFIAPVKPYPIPLNSIIREFLGASAFDY